MPTASVESARRGLNTVDSSTWLARQSAQRERLGVRVTRSAPIPRTVRFAEAPAVGRSILETARKSKGAAAYRAVAKDVLARI